MTGTDQDMRTRILLVDDQPMLRVGFRIVLEAEEDLVVVGEAGTGADGIELARTLEPDVVLMDVRMPGMSGIEATERIVAERPGCRVLILTTFDLDEYAFAGLRVGASGFLLKDAKPAELVSAIRAVVSGDAVVSPRVTRRMLEMFAQHLPAADASTPGNPELHPRLRALTSRELDVLRCMAEGLSNAEVAAALFLSEATVKSHVGRVLSKLEVRDRVQAVVLAYDAGLVRPS
jgi:DNA-binding NarL/FixJ family response regulator